MPGRRKGQPAAASEAGKARVLWTYDMWDQLGVFPCDAANGSPVIDGDLLYVTTSNGIDHNMDPYKEKNRKMPAPNAPNLSSWRSTRDASWPRMTRRSRRDMLHGQWSSVALGKVGGRKLVFFGGGDGCAMRSKPCRRVPEPAGAAENGLVVATAIRRNTRPSGTWIG